MCEGRTRTLKIECRWKKKKKKKKKKKLFTTYVLFSVQQVNERGPRRSDSLMNTSSSDDLREEFANGDLPFDMELSGLTIHEKLTAPVASPWRSQNASAWASSQGLQGTFARLLQKTSSFDLVPDSSKLVVLDVSLSVQVAFQALRENGIKSAPLWDSEEREFVGLVSISDFVSILTVSYSEAASECGADVLACDAHVQNHLSQSIAYWRERLNPIPHLIFVTPEDSVFECSAVMLQHNIHRVAILDSATHTVMFLMTHSVILSFFLAATSTALRQPVFGKTLLEAGTENHVGKYSFLTGCLKV